MYLREARSKAPGGKVVKCLDVDKTTQEREEEEEDGEVRVPEGWQVARRQEAAQGQLGLVHSSSR